MNDWTLLLVTLPSREATLRMRLWRQLKATGAALLRDGVYLLPAFADQSFWDALASDVRLAGGEAERLSCSAEGADQEMRFRSLLGRDKDYAQFIERLRQQTPVPRMAARLRREWQAIVTVDYFPNERQAEALAVLTAFERLAMPDEPSARVAAITRRDPANYQGQLWATRKRPWVDRLASAWLIERFIDAQARFLWLDSPANCPANAIGFDFDAAEFSHVGECVTFETLLIQFGLDSDSALNHLARIVRFLDAGGIPQPEAAGLEAMLSGMRTRVSDDEALRYAANQLFDDLYTAWQEAV